MGHDIPESERQARAVFAGPATGRPEELLRLAKRLRDEDNNLEYSRRILQIASANLAGASQPVQYSVRRDLILCTYKSPDQPPDERLRQAETLAQSLLRDGSLTVEQRQDLFGIIGAIWKTRWTVYGLREHLERSLAYYREGMILGEARDGCYTAINAAFVLELLAALAGDPAGKLAVQSDARQIRERVCQLLLAQAEKTPGKLEDFWFLATLGEAYLGLRNFEEAKRWMELAGERQPAPWQLETTARQAAKLASMIAAESNIPPTELETSAPWVVVRALMGGNSAAAMSFLLGKVGLALSGGGFRASLFHIGVLARLAELDVLRHVEVISCVSGGSIVGAYYCLELRKKLQAKSDDELQRSDFIEIVKSLERNFVKGVQRNIRLRMLMEFQSNLRVLYSPKSSMTDRLAALYDRELYSRVEDEFGAKRRSLSEIMIQPKAAPANFNPKYDNWTRRNKVPSLVLNATSLNTCHNWQFTASFMGEPPPRGIQTDIDANDRFRRMYHDEAPPALQTENGRVKLSEAVAASACVPLLFDPLVLDGLYGTTFDPDRPEDFVVRLVDGGAYDNQGIASLLEQNCTVLLVSDACGQTSVSRDPGGGRVEVLQRSNDVLMARVREAQYQHLATLRDTGALRGVMYVHLKKDLDSTPVDWIDCPDRSQRAAPSTMTPYGMRRDIQKRLAALRTDLDSFSDCEADALMLSAYLMTYTEFEACIKDFPVCRGSSSNWGFQAIAPIAANETSTNQTHLLRKALELGQSISLKPWKASKTLQAIAFVCALAVLAAFVFICVYTWRQPLSETALAIHTGRTLAIVTGVVVGLALLRTVLSKYLRYRNPYGQVVASVLICIVGWIMLRIHLQVIEPFYLRFGPKYEGTATQVPPPPAKESPPEREHAAIAKQGNH
jgi:predicted acylesterase/phospholipase RssA